MATVLIPEHSVARHRVQIDKGSRTLIVAVTDWPSGRGMTPGFTGGSRPKVPWHICLIPTPESKALCLGQSFGVIRNGMFSML